MKKTPQAIIKIVVVLAVGMMGAGCTVSEVIHAEQTQLNIASLQVSEAMLLDVGILPLAQARPSRLALQLLHSLLVLLRLGHELAPLILRKYWQIWSREAACKTTQSNATQTLTFNFWMFWICCFVILLFSSFLIRASFSTRVLFSAATSSDSPPADSF